MNQLGRLLIGFGVTLVLCGGVLLALEALGLGRLPGDLSWRGKNVSVHVPLATSLLLSVIVTVLLNLWLGRQR